MNADTLLSLTLASVEGFIGVVILLRNRNSTSHRLFFAFVVLLTLWGLADVVLRFVEDQAMASVFYDIGAIGFCFSPALYLHFMALFTNSPSPLFRPSFYVLLYGSGLALTLFLLMGYITRLDPSEGAFTVAHSTGYALWIAWIVVCVMTSAAFLIKRLRAKTLPHEARFSMRLLLAGLLVSVGVGVVLDALVPLYGFRPILSAGVSSLVVVVCTAFALIRYHGMAPTSEAVASMVFDAITDLVCVVDLEGEVTFAARNFLKALERDQDDSRGMLRIQDFVEESDHLREVLRNGRTLEQPFFVEVRFVRKSRTTFPVSLSIARLGLEDAPPGLVLIGRDITERNELTRKAAESEEKYRQIVESSLDGIVIIQDGNLVFVNPSAVQTFGYEGPEEMLTASFGDTVAPGSKPFLIRNYDSNKIGDDIFHNYEMKGLTKSGAIIDLEINAKLISWNGKPAVQASFRNVTERKNLEREQALWFWEQESLSAIDKQLVAMVDLESVLNTVTHHARAFCRADFSGVMMVNMEEQFYHWKGVRGNLHAVEDTPFPLKDVHRELLEKRGPATIRNLGSNRDFPLHDLPVLAREGVVTIASFPFRLEHKLEGVLIVGFRRDRSIGERETRLLASLGEKAVIAVSNAGLYESLREHERELEHLSHARVVAQEDERRRIAREIHDGLGQMLTAIKFSVEVMEDSLDLKSAEKGKLDEIKQLLDNVMTEAREISYNLMPSVLDDFGLAPALQLLCETFSKRLNSSAVFMSHGANGRF